MTTKMEMLDSHLDSETLDLQRDTQNWLDALKKMIGFQKKSDSWKSEVEKKADSWKTEVEENNWTKTEVFEYEWAIGFNYNQTTWEKWQILTRKTWNTYKVRVKKKVQFPNWEDWQTQKFHNKETFDFIASDQRQFNIELWKALDKKIENRQKLPKTGKTVYDMLNKQPQQSGLHHEQWGWNIEQAETKKTNLKEKPIDLNYTEKNKEKKVSINFPSNHYSVEWRVTRCLRWTSITDAVEDRYWIPRWLLMALMAQEWRGDPTVINQKSNWKCDWWAWLIHMQATNAADFWLDTLPRSNNGMVDYQHWDRLKKAKEDNHDDLKKMSELDDRFNPVLSVDASARFLVNIYNSLPQDKRWTDRWLHAVNAYAGRWMQDYWYAVVVYRTTINSIRWKSLPTFTREIEKVKNWEVSANVNGHRENTNLCINRTKDAMQNLTIKLDGKSVSYNDFLTYQKWQCDNFWLQQYTIFDKEHPYFE